jgi:ATP-dependent DNA ligase
MVRLECTTAGHNKFYAFDIQRTNGHVKVIGRYGAIGKAPQETIIYDGDSDAEARKQLDKKQNEKLRKGYVVVAGDDAPSADKKEGDDDSHLPAIWPMKLDGMRAIVHVTAIGLRIFSRSAGVADPFHPLEKTSALPHLAKLKFPTLIGTILDCEILAPGKDCATISGLVNSKNGTNGAVGIYAFDVLAFCGTDWTGRILGQRLSTLKYIEPLLKSPHLEVLPWYSTTKAKHRLYSDVINSNAEGLMLKNLQELYVQGGRPNHNWFKFKKSATFDCVVLGFTKGAGKYNSRIGAVRFGQYVNGRLIEIGQASGMSDKERLDMSLNPERYIGSVVTIKGQERLRSGAIRHPVFLRLNDHKHPKDCIWYKNEQ